MFKQKTQVFAFETSVLFSYTLYNIIINYSHHKHLLSLFMKSKENEVYSKNQSELMKKLPFGLVVAEVKPRSEQTDTSVYQTQGSHDPNLLEIKCLYSNDETQKFFGDFKNVLANYRAKLFKEVETESKPVNTS